MRVRIKNKRSAKRRCTGKGEAIAYYLQHKKAPPLALSSLVEYHPSEVVAPRNVQLDLLPPIWQSHFTGIKRYFRYSDVCYSDPHCTFLHSLDIMITHLLFIQEINVVAQVLCLLKILYTE